MLTLMLLTNLSVVFSYISYDTHAHALQNLGFFRGVLLIYLIILTLILLKYKDIFPWRAPR